MPFNGGGALPGGGGGEGLTLWESELRSLNPPSGAFLGKFQTKYCNAIMKKFPSFRV